MAIQMHRRLNDHEDDSLTGKIATDWVDDGRISIQDGLDGDQYRVTQNQEAPYSLDVFIPLAISAILKTEPAELEPLGYSIDVGQLQALYDNKNYSATQSITVSFTYMDVRVTVESPTELTIVHA